MTIKQKVLFSKGTRVVRDGGTVSLISSSNTLQFDLHNGPFDTIVKLIETGEQSYSDIVNIYKSKDSIELATVYYCLSTINASSFLDFDFEINHKPFLKLHTRSLVSFKQPWYSASNIKLKESSLPILSRFAFIRSLGKYLCLESPFNASAIELTDPKSLLLVQGMFHQSTIAELETEFSQEQLSVLIFVLEKIGALEHEENSKDKLKYWEFHDLLFHSRSRLGRNVEGYGGTFNFIGKNEALPVSKRYLDEDRGLCIPLQVPSKTISRSFSEVLESRCSIRDFGSQSLSITELSDFLYRSLRVIKKFKVENIEASKRPYPTGGAVYDLEVYPLINNVRGIEAGLYHYDATSHELVNIPVNANIKEKVLANYARTYLSVEPPQVTLLVTSRFGRIAWKYSSMAYSLAMKHVGVLYQTFYLVGTDIGLATCALGGGNSDLFSDLSGIDYYEEPLVGEFILGSRVLSN